MTNATLHKKEAGHLRQQVPAVVPTDEEKNMTTLQRADDRVQTDAAYRATYECGRCDFRIADHGDDTQEYAEAIDRHEETHTDGHESAINHPAWCEPERCNQDRTGGYLRDVMHWSAPARLTMTVDNYDEVAGFEIARSDNYDGRLAAGQRQGVPVGYIEMSRFTGNVTAEDIDRLGSWLKACAIELDRAVAGDAKDVRPADALAAEGVGSTDTLKGE